MEDNEVFDKVEQPVMEEPEEVSFGDVSDNIKFDVQLTPEDTDKVFEIATVEMRKPILIDANGNEVEPKHSKKDPKKVYYQTKLVVTFKDSNYAAILPNIKWFKQLVQENGKTIALYKPWFNTNVTEKDLSNKQVSEVSKTFYRYCKAKKLDVKKVTQKQFLTGLVGSKVKLVSESGTYDGRDYTVLKIREFV